MLSDKQLKLVEHKINKSVNIPIASETQEGKIIHRLVGKLNPHVEPALQAIIPNVYVECIRIALNETLDSKERRNQISELLLGELRDPFARELNGRVDVPMLPESMEGDVLQIVATKIIKEFVEWTVGELQEKLTAEYDADLEEASMEPGAGIEPAYEEE